MKEVDQMPRVKQLKAEQGRRIGIDRFPNFSSTGSVRGMKEKFYGKDALLVRCGSYIYNVTEKPEIYYGEAK